MEINAQLLFSAYNFYENRYLIILLGDKAPHEADTEVVACLLPRDFTGPLRPSQLAMISTESMNPGLMQRGFCHTNIRVLR